MPRPPACAAGRLPPAPRARSVGARRALRGGACCGLEAKSERDSNRAALVSQRGRLELQRRDAHLVVRRGTHAEPDALKAAHDASTRHDDRRHAPRHRS
eukprot:7230265-Prymnesium_polylepis.1